MLVTLAVPTLTRYDLLVKLIESAERGSRKPDRYFIVDNGGHLRANLDDGKLVFPTVKDMQIVAAANMGVAASWNLALRRCGDWTIISGDDVELHERTIEKFIVAAEAPELQDCGMLVTDQVGVPEWSLFLHKIALTERVGWYDQKFWPAYYEDNDYAYRMKLAGEHRYAVAGAGCEHVGSATVKAMDAAATERHHFAFCACQATYIAKWGGLPGLETRTVPLDVQADL